MTDYNISDIVNSFPKVVKIIFLLDNTNLNEFEGYYGYLFKIVILAFAIISFIAGKNETSPKTDAHYDYLKLKEKLRTSYIRQILIFLLKLFVIIIFSYGVSLVCAFGYLKDNYLYLTILFISLLLISLLFYSFGLLIFSINKYKLSIILTFLLFIMIYGLSIIYQCFDINIIGFISLLEIGNINIEILSISVFLITTAFIILITLLLGYQFYKKKDLIKK